MRMFITILSALAFLLVQADSSSSAQTAKKTPNKVKSALVKKK
jgi:hypothetical protein